MKQENPFTAMDKAYRDMRRVDACRNVIEELNGKMTNLTKNPEHFKKADFSNARRRALREIKLILKEEWNG